MSFIDTLRFLGFPEEIEGELYFWPTPPKCAVCGGDLIRSEVRWSTCGHCGGRSISRRDASASQMPRPGELLGEGT